MPAPVHLDKMLTEGYLRRIKLEVNQNEGPTPGKHWLVLYGILNHVTATQTTLYMKDRADNATPLWIHSIVAGTGSSLFPLFPVSDATLQAGCSQQMPLMILSDSEIFNLNTGGTGAYVNITVLEW